MIKPIDIQQKEFMKVVRGYKEEEVNVFLDEITVDLERIIDELRQTKEENSRLVEEIERYRKSEGTLLETLEAAKTLMADISTSAEKRATILLKNAELDAELIKKEAREMSEKIQEETKKTKANFIDFRTRYKKLLKGELHRFESLSGDLFPELGVDDFDDLPQMPEMKENPKIEATQVIVDTPKPMAGTYTTSTNEEITSKKTMRNIKF